MPEAPISDALIHEIFPVGLLHCNCHILGDPVTREAIVIDPGDDVQRILEALQRHALRVKAIISTHAHIDHVGGLRRLHEVTGAPVLMHGDDLDLYSHLDQQAAWLGIPVPESAHVDQLLREGDTVRWGPYAVQVLHTPGHTRGSLSLFLPGAAPSGDASSSVAGNPSPPLRPGNAGKLFAGDTLFAGSIGRTDLWGGSLPEILRSIHQKMLIFPDDTQVYPGHGPATTIGQERAANPFLQQESPPPWPSAADS